MTGDVRIRCLEVLGDREIAGLCDVLIDCVEGGASVSFMLPMSRAKAEAFWKGAAASVARSERVVLAAEDSAGSIVGTVQVVWAQPENQPHRGDLAKMLVHRRGRRRGMGAALLAAAERAALDAGKTLLVLDTVTGGDAERLYARHGWQRCGEIPDYALWPDGGLCSTTVFFKRLLQGGQGGEARVRSPSGDRTNSRKPPTR
jgi:GNAT superfamily N-acetyltransferase